MKFGASGQKELGWGDRPFSPPCGEKNRDGGDVEKDLNGVITRVIGGPGDIWHWGTLGSLGETYKGYGIITNNKYA